MIAWRRSSVAVLSGRRRYGSLLWSVWITPELVPANGTMSVLELFGPSQESMVAYEKQVI
jgi:hypothetical protein